MRPVDPRLYLSPRISIITQVVNLNLNSETFEFESLILCPFGIQHDARAGGGGGRAAFASKMTSSVSARLLAPLITGIKTATTSIKQGKTCREIKTQYNNR